MAHLRGDRPFASIHKILKMLLSPHSSHKPANQDTDMAEDVDEPPDQRFLSSSHMDADDDDTVVYVKSPAVAKDQKESLLTRALKSSPELEASHRRHPSAYDHSLSYRSYPHSNVSGVSTAELTSDGGMTSPSLSTTSSPPLPSQMTRKSDSSNKAGNSQRVADPNESTVEANLGRKRCISFACGRKSEDQQKPQSQQQQQPQLPTSQQKPPTQATPAEPVKRKTVLTFVCPARDSNPPRERSPVRKESQRSRLRGSPAPVARKASPPEKEEPAPVSIPQTEQPRKPSNSNERRGIPTWGLGKFEESEETRFHEFASSVEEDDDWVAKAAEYTEKITMNDCMKKENAIRKLGEEAEQEALDEDDDDDDEDDDDDDDSADEDDDEDEDDEDDISTVHDLDVDDGNESDNEAGFADSDESDAGSDYGFWAPTSTTAATSPQTIDVPHPTIERRLSTASYDSPHDNDPQNWPPALTGKHMPGRRSSKTSKTRPGTPNLPDSTDFVCGTLDEDRPLEAAYKSCMEQRRLSKQVVIPQDIDPSFPTSDPEDEDDDDDEEEDEVEDEVPDEAARGRSEGPQARKPSPHPSPPKRMVSPPPRRQGRSSPKRLRSPPPPMKFKLPSKVQEQGDDSVGVPELHPQGLNISELVQRPSVIRTKSLPRTPNPFFASLDQMPRRSTIGSQVGDSSEREMHTRGPVDIVEGLEKKRQKRKEKFWRQHCRKAAKEQTNRRPIRGKGAERMKELGLEAAERCRAYGVGEDVQLVLSV